MQTEDLQFGQPCAHPCQPPAPPAGSVLRATRGQPPHSPLGQVSPSLLPIPAPDAAAGRGIRQPEQVQMPKPRARVSTLNFHCWIVRFREKAAARMVGRHAGLGGGFCTVPERPRCYKKALQQF